MTGSQGLPSMIKVAIDLANTVTVAADLGNGF